jgi:hypothetical protein
VCTKLQAYRDNHRIAVDDRSLAAALWENTGMCDVCAALQYNGKPAIGLHRNIRFYRYSVGQKFGRHVDDSVHLADGAETGYTLLMYLNGVGSKKSRPLTGGETVFFGDKGERRHTVVPKCGMALLHLHGEECMEHEATEVRGGCKYILRSDVVFGCVPSCS